MVLIVDDLKENLIGLKKILELSNFQVDIANSGEEALKKVLKNTYSLIILDVQMPGMDGFEVAEALSGFNRAKDIPIIFLSAVNTTKEFITRGFQSGGYDYVKKPLDPEIFILKVKNLHKLSEKTRELKNAYHHLEKEIDERKAAERRKEEFLSLAGHELKTPLTRTKGYVQLLKKAFHHADKADICEQYLQRAELQIEKLNLLVAGLLDLATIEAGKMDFKMELISPEEVICSAVNTFSRVYPDYSVLRTGTLPDQLYADHVKMEQVIIDYLSNAAKYSPDIKEIQLQTTYDRENLTVKVRDRGIGISADKLPRLFQKYYRAEDSYNQFQGLGISLYICSEIIRRHKGSYGVESIPGSGSTFYFTMPTGTSPNPPK